MNRPTVLGLIPARGGSKGIPNKNLRVLAGKPLLAYTSECARACGVLNRVILSTDSEEIAAAGRALGLEVPFMRPQELALDSTPMVPVIQHAIATLAREGWTPEVVVLLQPTAPLRRPEHICKAVELYCEGGCDSVVGVTEIPGHFHPMWSLKVEGGLLREVISEGLKITRRQELPLTYTRDGSVYLFRTDLVMSKGTIYGERCKPLIINPEDSINLDSMEDWEVAQKKMQERNRD